MVEALDQVQGQWLVEGLALEMEVVKAHAWDVKLAREWVEVLAHV
jgi:hypothetical protein